jgi:hypothetical protein
MHGWTPLEQLCFVFLYFFLFIYNQYLVSHLSVNLLLVYCSAMTWLMANLCRIVGISSGTRLALQATTSNSTYGAWSCCDSIVLSLDTRTGTAIIFLMWPIYLLLFWYPSLLFPGLCVVLPVRSKNVHGSKVGTQLICFLHVEYAHYRPLFHFYDRLQLQFFSSIYFAVCASANMFYCYCSFSTRIGVKFLWLNFWAKEWIRVVWPFCSSWWSCLWRWMVNSCGFFSSFSTLWFQQKCLPEWLSMSQSVQFGWYSRQIHSMWCFLVFMLSSCALKDLYLKFLVHQLRMSPSSLR